MLPETRPAMAMPRRVLGVREFPAHTASGHIGPDSTGELYCEASMVVGSRQPLGLLQTQRLSEACDHSTFTRCRKQRPGRAYNVLCFPIRLPGGASRSPLLGAARDTAGEANAPTCLGGA